MAIAAVLALRDEDGRRALFSRKGAVKRARRTHTWATMELRDGYWVDIRWTNYRPTLIASNQKLMREYK